MKRHWDALVVVAVATILLAVQIMDFRADRARMTQGAKILRLHDASRSIAQLESWLAERSNMVTSLAGTLELMPGQHIGEYLNRMVAVSSDLENTYVGFSDGSLVTPGRWTPPPGFLLKNRPWFSEALDKVGVTVVTPYRDLRINQQVIAFSSPFTTLDGKRGVVATVVPISRVQELIRTVQGNYSATLRAGSITVASVSRGDQTKLTGTVESEISNGWHITYRMNERPDYSQLATLALRELAQWTLEVLAVILAWLAINGYIRSRTKAALKGLRGTREVRVPAVLSDLPPTIVSLSRDVAAYPEVLLQLLALKDHYTARHSRHVADLAVKIGRKLGLAAEVISELHSAGVLHDIGKVGITEPLLNKPGALTEDEWVQMRRHPGVGASVALRAGMKQTIVEAIRDHHERLDGSGYPTGCSGSELGLLTRIIAVADVYDAMTSDRPYRPALPSSEALEHLSDEALYDQRVVDALRSVRTYTAADKDELAIGGRPDSSVQVSCV